MSSRRRKRPLRILMIAPTSFFSEYGGHIRIYEETRALQDLGHEVTIVTYYMGDDIPGFDIRRTAPLPYRADYEVGSSRHKIAFDVYLSVQSLLESLRVRPDIIHGHMHEGALIGGVLSRLLRVPLVFDFQGSLTAEMIDHNFLDPNGRFFPWLYWLEGIISRRLPRAILTSSLRASKLLQHDFAVPPHIIHPLPDCADTEKFVPNLLDEAAKQAMRRQLGIPPQRLVVAYLGLLTNYQGIPHLLETAVKTTQAGANLHFLIMGYPNMAYYQQMVAEKGIQDRVTLTGKIPYREAAQFLALGDIAVAPKMSATEGSGKLLNYMAMAQPVVAYDSPVHREYLADIGVYAPMGNVQAFADGVLALARDPQQREQLGVRLRQRAVEKYSWRQAGMAIERVYQRLTD